MFDFRTFVKRGLVDAVNKQSNYWVMLNAAAYYEKGVLFDADLEEIKTLIDSTMTEEEVKDAQIEDMTEALDMMEVEPIYEIVG